METKEKIAARVFRYLQQHPDASDTLEGVAKWWLESERVNYTVDMVAEALDEMIGQGLLKKIERKDGRVIYQVK
jgi:hypothetical protein